MEVEVLFIDFVLVIGLSCFLSNDLGRIFNDEIFIFWIIVRFISCIKMKKKMKVDKFKNKFCFLVLICEKFEKFVWL